MSEQNCTIYTWNYWLRIKQIVIAPNIDFCFFFTAHCSNFLEVERFNFIFFEVIFTEFCFMGLRILHSTVYIQHNRFIWLKSGNTSMKLKTRQQIRKCDCKTKNTTALTYGVHSDLSGNLSGNIWRI